MIRLLKTGPELCHNQPEVEPGDQGRHDPARESNPGCVDEFSHDAGVSCELDKGHHGKAELHAEHHLADEEKARRRPVAGNRNHDECRHDCQRSGDEPANPRRDPDAEEALHDHLARECARESAVLSRGQKRHGEERARACRIRSIHPQI